jgi:hypothetical protein
MLRAVSGEPTQTRSSPWWRQAATLLGVTGLFVTLVFNTLAVRQSAQQDNEARETAQISLLTQLNSNTSDGEHAISASSAPESSAIRLGRCLAHATALRCTRRLTTTSTSGGRSTTADLP